MRFPSLDGTSPMSKLNEIYISSAFEVGNHGVMPPMYEFQDLAGREWLQIAWNESGMVGGFSQSFEPGSGWNCPMPPEPRKVLLGPIN